MGHKDKLDLDVDDMALVPLDESPHSEKDDAAKLASSAESGKAKFNIDKRSYEDRREANDRRSSIRFEEERRKGQDRRSSSANWDTL